MLRPSHVLVQLASFALTAVLVPVLSHGAGLDTQCSGEQLSEKDVIDANRRFQNALISSDVEALRRLLSPDFQYITFSGEERDRAELLRSYGAKEVQLKRYDVDDVILTALAFKEGSYVSGPRNGSVFTGRYRITRVYACSVGHGWQLVSTHESRAEQKEP
jgi:hypothetical protein